MNKCVKCATPSPGLALCAHCATALKIDLVDVPDLLANLDITRSKQDQLISPYDHGPRSAEIPLPYKPHIGEVVWVLHNTLATWVDTITPANSTRAVTQPTPALARRLVTHLDNLQRRDDAGQALDELTHVIRYARAAIDRPGDQRLILGPCSTGPCMATVYGQPGRTLANCPACGAQHNIAYRQNWMRQAAQDHLGSAVEIAGFLRIIGVSCTANQIRSYAARKRLLAAGHRPPASPLYRIRDVLTALSNRYRRHPEKPGRPLTRGGN